LTHLITMNKSIEFISYKGDKPNEIQLKPEAFIFVVQPGNKLNFEPVNPNEDFHWAIRIDHENKGIQLFPNGRYYGVNIYENGKLNTDWSDLYSS
jgi:hypothetical protein